jgi:hypothetical protein
LRMLIGTAVRSRTTNAPLEGMMPAVHACARLCTPSEQSGADSAGMPRHATLGQQRDSDSTRGRQTRRPRLRSEDWHAVLCGTHTGSSTSPSRWVLAAAHTLACHRSLWPAPRRGIRAPASTSRFWSCRRAESGDRNGRCAQLLQCFGVRSVHTVRHA